MILAVGTGASPDSSPDVLALKIRRALLAASYCETTSRSPPQIAILNYLPNWFFLHRIIIDSAPLILPLPCGLVLIQSCCTEELRRAMKQRIKLATTALVLLLALVSFTRFMHWMNLPSDLWFWSGVTASLLLLVVVPSLIAGIWRIQRH
jgi:hypothetical protein